MGRFPKGSNVVSQAPRKERGQTLLVREKPSETMRRENKSIRRLVCSYSQLWDEGCRIGNSLWQREGLICRACLGPAPLETGTERGWGVLIQNSCDFSTLGTFALCPWPQYTLTVFVKPAKTV